MRIGPRAVTQSPITGFLLWLEQSKSRAIWISLLFLTLISLIDYGTGYQFQLNLFYLVPVILIAWSCGLRWGAVTAALCAVVWTLTGLLAGRSYATFAAPLWNFSMRCGVLLTVCYLVASYRTLLLAERELARNDSLTHLANRRHFMAMLEREIARSKRNRHPFTLVYIDVDDFKSLNDNRGHAAGDRALCLIAQALDDGVRSMDTVARPGGDEFTLLLCETNADMAIHVAKRLFGSIKDLIAEHDWPIGVSVGLVTFDEVDVEAEEALQIADRAMYEAKVGGKNRIHYAVHKAVNRSQGLRPGISEAELNPELSDSH